MNNKRKKFEEMLGKANLSDEQKELYRRLNWELLRLRVINGINKVTKWAEKIKPLIAIDENSENIIFQGTSDKHRKMIVTNVAFDANILTFLTSGVAVLKLLNFSLNRLCVFTAYLSNSENNSQLPELSVINVLRQLPENVTVGQARFFEVRFNSERPEDDYDEILQAHKVKIILYAPSGDSPKNLNVGQRQLPSKSEDKEQSEQSAPVALKKIEKKKNLCPDVPQRQL